MRIFCDEEDTISNAVMTATGHNGRLELEGSVLRIKRKGISSLATQAPKGVEEIHISHISSIHLKKANTFLNGYIRFSLVGAQPAKGGITQGVQNENSVVFRLPQQPVFEAFGDELHRRISATAPGNMQLADRSLRRDPRRGLAELTKRIRAIL